MKQVTCVFIALLIGFLVAACQTPSRPTANQTGELMPTPMVATSTLEPMHLSTVTPSPSASGLVSDILPLAGTPSPTPSHTYTPRPTTTPSPSPLPTLVPEAASALVLNLLESNADCQLPCWWGAVPGETEWQTIRPFLQSFSLQIYGSNTPSQQASYDVSFYLPGAIQDRFTIVYNTRQKIIQSIDVYLGNTPYYSLSSVLTTYGRPDEVWVAGQRPISPDERYLSMKLALLYVQRRFAIYYTFDEHVEDQSVFSCFKQDQVSGKMMWIWSSRQNITSFSQAREELDLRVGGYFLTLAEVSDLSLEQFHQTFKDPGYTACLETPARLWPTTFGWPDGTPTPTPTP